MKLAIKISWKTEIIPIIILLLCGLASIYFYNHFPTLVATHWNLQGQPDGYSGKTFAAFFFPALLILMYLLFVFLPQFDPKRERYAEFSKVYNIFRHLIVGIMAIIFLATGLYNLGYDINIGIVTASSIGLMMIVLGYYMKEIKSNWFIGIRTPWTLSSENVWNKTHRLGGILFMVFGLILVIMPFLPETLAIFLTIAWIIILLLGTFGYSYWLFRQEKKSGL